MPPSEPWKPFGRLSAAYSSGSAPPSAPTTSATAALHSQGNSGLVVPAAGLEPASPHGRSEISTLHRKDELRIGIDRRRSVGLDYGLGDELSPRARRVA